MTGLRRLAVAVAVAAAASGSVSLGPAAGAATPPPGPNVSFAYAVTGGNGFDICEAPSSATMRAWLRSPFRSVNIYFGGSQRFCQPTTDPSGNTPSQRYLSREWVRTVTANGWQLIPTYVGLQAPCSTNRTKARMSSDPTTAQKQGHDAALDAVTGSGAGGGKTTTTLPALGLPKHTPAYIDIEPFTNGSATCDRAVRRFLLGWIDELRSLGYRAGVYGLPTEAIRVLVQAHKANPAYPVPDAIWFARYDGHNSVSSADIPSTYLPNHRIHQYLAGVNVTYGGITLNIDKDAMRGDVVRATSFTVPTGPPFDYAIAGEPRNPDGTAQGGVHIRTAPNTSATIMASLHDGDLLQIDCQAVGQTVNGDYVWDKIETTDPLKPGYVSDLYTNTTGGFGISAQIDHCDTTPPSPTLNPLPTATLAANATVSYSATDPTVSGNPDGRSGVATYDVRWRRARYNGGFGAWTYPATWQRTTAKTQTLPLAPGYTYCFAVRARDRATNVSGWTPQGCVARALDDRALSGGSAWIRATGKPFYFHTISATKLYRATLSLAGAQMRQLGLVATVGPGAGSVRVLLNGVSIATRSLNASSTAQRQILLLPAFASLRIGTVTIRVITSGKPVKIDGLVVFR